jgi:Fe-S-cluster containining protein
MGRPHSREDTRQAVRMDSEHLFRFHCFPGVSCFTQCCQDVTIVLTPYDVLRLKGALGISSGEFIEKHTHVLNKENQLIPLVMLNMREEDKKCPFVTLKGCTVYQNRPWACRMYPLDMADDGTFHLIPDSGRCKGLQESTVYQIGEWLVEQEIVPYEEMNSLLTDVIAPLKAQKLDIDNPDISKMVFMSLYNLDTFRDFVFKSTFLERFELEPILVEKIKRSDIELLKFAIDWIKFGLFGQKLFKLKQKPENTEQNAH